MDYKSKYIKNDSLNQNSYIFYKKYIKYKKKYELIVKEYIIILYFINKI